MGKEIGTREKQPTREGGVLFVCAHPTPSAHSFPLPVLVAKQNDPPSLSVSHSLLLPTALCPGQSNIQPERGPLQQQPWSLQSPKRE